MPDPVRPIVASDPPSFFGMPAEDPLARDVPDDATVTITARTLMRVIVVSAEAGARFQREPEGGDASAWLLNPQRLFDGATAIEACFHLSGFKRALFLLALGFPLDADASELDGKIAPGGIL